MCLVVLLTLMGLFANGLNEWLRRVDFWLNRTDGGTKRFWRLDGYSFPMIFWTFLALHIVVFGPTQSMLNDSIIDALNYETDESLTAAQDDEQHLKAWLKVGGVAAASLFVFGLMIVSFAWVARRAHWLHALTTTLLLVACLWIWLAGADAKVMESRQYRHIFVLFVAWAGIIGYAGRLLTFVLLRGFKKRYGNAWTNSELLQKTELFVKSRPASFHFWQIIRSAIDTPIRKLHLFLLPIAFVILLVPHAYMHLAAIVATMIVWCLLTVSGIDERLNMLLNWLERGFFHGLFWAVSLIVIGLALCRFFDFSYVAIIMNSALEWTLVWFLIAIYATIWFYKYWIGQTLCEHLLALLHNDKSGRTRLVYPIDQGSITTDVMREGRFLQIHGTRFVAVGKKHGLGGNDQEAWEFYDSVGLFEALIKNQAGISIASNEQNPPADSQDIESKFGLSDLRQRVHFYYVFLDAMVVIFLGAFFWYRYHQDPIAELSARLDAKGVYSLEDRLFERKREETPRAVVFVAASGGGTRAALYTASVFRGLGEIDALADVRLCSGVSGGSAAIAYLTIHHESLVKPENFKVVEQSTAWNRYAKVLNAPFIDDVFRGTLEFRVAKGTCMGTLLAESFQRRMHHHDTLPGDGSLIGTRKLGVIFNTTLAGTDYDPLKRPVKPVDSTESGSRLIVTNLHIENGTFPAKGFEGAENEFLPYVVVQDSKAPLTSGAALSANFPPVFSNAAIELESNGQTQERHWITDGGASENRGAVSMLYVLLNALQKEAKKPKLTEGVKPEDARRKPLPVRIVIADASGVSRDFTQDRGISSALGASEKYADQLMVELLKKIQAAYAELDGKDLRVHFLPMPLLFRSRGGVPTHWMLPTFVTLTNPSDPDNTITISGELALKLIMDLHHLDGKRHFGIERNADEEKQLTKAWEWIANEHLERPFEGHPEAWKELRESFKAVGYKVR